MRQGADRAALKERKDDLYETPAQAVTAFMRVAPSLPTKFWEPCAGRGAIARILSASGHEVIASDLVAHPGADAGIETPIDFLMERRPPPGVSKILTNPPYKLADEFIRHGLRLGCEVTVLLRLMAMEGAGRSDLIDLHLTHVWAGIERLPSMHREGYEGPKQSNSGAPFAWFRFSPKARDKGEPIALRRMSWRAA